MDNYKRILEIVKKNNGYVTTKEVVENGINNMFLTNMVKKGALTRISRGYYGLPDYIEDNYYIILSKSQNARFSMSTALYLHNLSDRTPLEYHITLPSDYSGSLQKEKNVHITYVKKNILELGTITMQSPFGMPIKVYDMERTICDTIKFKDKMDVEIFTTALKEYARCKDKNLGKLAEYAKKMNIEQKVYDCMLLVL